MSPDQLGKPLKVLRRIQETPDAVSLVLEIPDSLRAQYRYQAGQFVTFFMNMGGEPLNRSYSLSSSPLVDKEFKITVKKVPLGRGSTFLCEQVQAGDTLLTTPPAGHFFKPSLEPKGTHYFLFAAGSGITPIYSIMKTVLSATPLNQVTLVFCNRNEESIIYREELDQWAKDHPARLDIVHVLSKPSDTWPGRPGRIHRQLIGEIVEMPARGASAREYYICGPTEFMNTVKSSLAEHGVPAELIRIEDFAVALHKPTFVEKDSWTFIGPGTTSESPEKIVAEINGEIVEVAAKEGQSILETLLEAGAQPPYSCMDGSCMACLGKIQEGRVYQEDPGILIDENIKNCESLTCQAKPLSRIVKVTYDNI
ncbi:MAG TPA: ferredoxin--NADP reductase [Bdellovibrionales bacterium]|nr:ferredoxin--NADP reductase [Bdellovibrionales bacterium]